MHTLGGGPYKIFGKSLQGRKNCCNFGGDKGGLALKHIGYDGNIRNSYMSLYRGYDC